MKKTAFLYVLNKKEYIKEAEVSVSSIKKWVSEADCILVGNAEKKGGFDKLFRESCDSNNWLISSTYLIKKGLDILFADGYKNVILMDSDTFVCDAINELIWMLDFYDLLGVHSSNRQTAQNVYDIPRSFTELSTGVLPMRNSYSIRQMWVEIYEWLCAYQDDYKMNLQSALRDILWRYSWGDRRPKFYVIPPEYNLRFNYPFVIKDKARVLHGRSSDYSRVLEEINADAGKIRSFDGLS